MLKICPNSSSKEPKSSSSFAVKKCSSSASFAFISTVERTSCIAPIDGENIFALRYEDK